MRDVAIATGRSRRSTHWQNTRMTWGELVDRLRTTTRTQETIAEYRNLPKSEQDAIKDVGGFVGGYLEGGRRKNGAVKLRSMLTLDADYARPGLWDEIELLCGYACLMYSTHKHRPETPRVRLVIPLARDVQPDEYQAISRKVAEDLGIDQFDDTTHEPARLMYWPSTSRDGEYLCEVLDGPWLDPDAVLGEYVDWRDVSAWPQSQRVQARRQKMADKQGDPRAKPGLVGAFCRAYDVPAAIETFLPDIYTATAMEDRYSYAAGSTVAGAVVYDDGAFLYSNHATDPVGGRLCNAYDLVRLHKFGALDEDADPETPINRLPSSIAMQDLAREDKAVKRLLAQERAEQAKAEFAEEPEEDEDWATGLVTDRKGNVEPTADNILLILTHDPALKGCLAYNEFRGRVVVRRDLPWRRITDTLNGEDWRDVDDSSLRMYMESVYRINATAKIYDGVSIAADRAKFHPVREYITATAWDGEPRIDNLLIHYLGAEDSEYTRMVIRKTLIAAVRRVFLPGCKFDEMMVLVGRQGVGKSTFLRKLGGEWLTDSLTGVIGKDAYEQIQGFWIVEMGELSALRKAEVEATKNFISKQVDSYRAAYARRTEAHPRQCIFVGTTNNDSFLRDDTGNRRFWPVQVGVEAPLCSVWEDLTPDKVAQIWAEAYAYHLAGEALTLPPGVAQTALEQQEDYTEDDPKVGKVLEYLDRLYPTNWEDRDLEERRSYIHDCAPLEKGLRKNRVCIAEIWQECFCGDPRQLDRLRINELHSTMRRVPGWYRARGKQRCGKLYGVQRCYLREGVDEKLLK